MDHEAKFRLNRTTGKKLYLCRNVCGLLAQHFQNVCQRALLGWHIDHNAPCTILVMAHHQYYSMIKVGISNCRRRNQKLTNERTIYRCLAATWLCSIEKCLRNDNRC